MLCPGRSRASDGTCPSAAHHAQNPGSDHEPQKSGPAKGLSTAYDLTDDKPLCDADAMVEGLRVRRDHRVKYVIAERRMFSSYAGRDSKTGLPFEAWEWRPYHGSNPHSSHVHVSIWPEFYDDTSPWWEDEPMTETEMEHVADLAAAKVKADLGPVLEKIAESLAGRRTPTASNPDPRSTVGRIEAQANAIAKAVVPPADQ